MLKRPRTNVLYSKEIGTTAQRFALAVFVTAEENFWALWEDIITNDNRDIETKITTYTDRESAIEEACKIVALADYRKATE